MYESAAASFASWLTPSTLFIFLNLVIGTIVITSRYTSPKTQIHDSSQLARSPSLLDRVRSFNNYYYQSEQITESTQPHLVRTPSLLERVRSFDFSHYKNQPTHPETEYDHQPKLENPQLTRSPSLLQRLQSIKVSSLYRSDTVHGEKEPEREMEGPDSKMKESATETSETRWLREEEEVDAKADDFINRFKKQLRLQRVDSILRSRHMVNAN